MFQKIEELISTIYSEQDFSRSIATTLAGVAGLMAYLLLADVVISVFVSVIAFPLIRILAHPLNQLLQKNQVRESGKERQKGIWASLSPKEKGVLSVFVETGSSVISVDHDIYLNPQYTPAAVKSLANRDFLKINESESGQRKELILNPDIFDIAQAFCLVNK